MFKSPLRSFWALVSALLPPHFAIMGWDDAIYLAIAAASAAASGAGAYSANKAQNMEVEQRYKALKADRLRQQQLQEESDSRLRQETQKFLPENVDQNVDLAAATRNASAMPVPAAAPAQYQAASPAAPIDVKSESNRVLGGVAAKAREEAARRARLAAYGDVSQQQGFDLNRLGENLRRLKGESAGSTNIMGVESRLPDTGAQGWRNRADTANLIGQIGSLYSMGAGRKKTPTLGVAGSQTYSPYEEY